MTDFEFFMAHLVVCLYSVYIPQVSSDLFLKGRQDVTVSLHHAAECGSCEKREVLGLYINNISICTVARATA